MTTKTITTAQTVQNITGNTPLIGNYPPPPPPPPRKYSLNLKNFSRAKSYLFAKSLYLFFFLLLGCPQSMTTYVDVPIYITNTDTNIPMVTNHRFTVAENINLGTIIGTINASDDTAVISYLIIAGNDNYAFSINTNGQLKTIMTLDYDTNSNYTLTIQVSDAAGNSSNATIIVKVNDVDAAPSVATLGASQIQNNSVILSGNLIDFGSNSDGSEQVNERGFLYSTNASQPSNLQLMKSGVQRTSGDNPTSAGTYSQVIAGLSPGTAYYFRAFAVNDGGTSYGSVSNFSTTYHQNFTLSGASNGKQTALIHAHSIHTYVVTLSHELMYSLTVEADSNISSNVTVHEGLSTETFYIKAGPFTSQGLTFHGVSNGHRYMVLPLNSNSHRIVISNNSEQNESYSLNLEEYENSIS